MLLIPKFLFASNHIVENDLDIKLKNKPQPSDISEPIYSYKCSLNLDTLNDKALPEIYMFNLVDIIFDVRYESDWIIADIEIDKNIKNNLRNTVEQEFIKTKNAIKRGYFSENERHLTMIIEYFFKPTFGDAYNFDALNAQLTYMDEIDKDTLIKALEVLIVENAYNQIDNIQMSALSIEERRLSELVNSLKKKTQKNNLIFTDDNDIEILIRDYKSENNSKSLVVNLPAEESVLKLLGNCNLQNN